MKLTPGYMRQFVKDTRWLDKLEAYKPEQEGVKGRWGKYAQYLPNGNVIQMKGASEFVDKDLLCYVHSNPGAYKGQRRRSTGESTPKKRKSRGFNGRLADSVKGHERGTMVHQQMEHMVKLDHDGLSASHEEGIHQWPIAFMRFMLERKWVPVASELLVYCPILGLATRIDCIAIEEGTGRLIIIEFKTGYAGIFNQLDNRTRWTVAELTLLPRSERGKAQAQALFGAMLLMRIFDMPPEAFDVCVLQIDDETQKVQDFPVLSEHKDTLIQGIFKRGLVNAKKMKKAGL